MQVTIIQRQNVDIVKEKVLSSVRIQRRKKAHPVVTRKVFMEGFFLFVKQVTFKLLTTGRKATQVEEVE
jgi:hypothetical protein